MRNVDHNMTGRNDGYDGKPGCIYRPSSYGIRIENQQLDAITWAMIKAEVVCENSGSNGVRTFTETRRRWKRYFASMIVRCTMGKGIRSGQEPGVDRDQQAGRRDLINIRSFYLIVINTSTIYPEVYHYI